jgi:hypothetical protein
MSRRSARLLCGESSHEDRIGAAFNAAVREVQSVTIETVLAAAAWTGNAGYVFRAQRVRSLYRPGVGDPRWRQPPALSPSCAMRRPLVKLAVT